MRQPIQVVVLWTYLLIAAGVCVVFIQNGWRMPLWLEIVLVSVWLVVVGWANWSVWARRSR